VNRLPSTLALVILGLVVVAVTSRALITLAGALLPLIVVGGIVLALLRYVWFHTRF
jgi:hypothetical protein